MTTDTNEPVPLDSIVDQLINPRLGQDISLVCGTLTPERIELLRQAGIKVVINLQSDTELSFDEEAAVKKAGMVYYAIPIANSKDLKQVNVLALERILRSHHGQKIAAHCSTGERVGAMVALRAGWLRGRKMETCLNRGKAHGLTDPELIQQVHNRLLVPR